MPLATGTRLGAYEILSPLGQGGMGIVYRARDTKLNRDLALKVLPAEFALDPERVARFKREAQVLASLDHPNIGGIYDFEDADGSHALVLQLVEGPTLADRIAEGAIPLDEALSIAGQIADALEAAHEKGIIHRDLKPANIKATADGRVKVLDFGLAKLLEPSASAGTGRSGDGLVTNSPTITTPAATMAGVILGTAAYMSPEQAKGRPADKRSDLWGFGCVLYEMLSGKRAFDGEDVSETLAAVIRGEPDWSMLPADLTPSVRLLLQRCLAKDRRQRVGDIAVAKFVLAEPRMGAVHDAPAGPVVAPLPTSGWRRAVPIAATAAVTTALVSAAGILFRPSTSASIVARFPVTLPEGQTLPANVSSPVLAISPDGTKLVYVASNRLFLRSLSELESHAIPGSDTNVGIPWTPVFSPDGQSIVYGSASDRALKRVSLGGGAGVKLCPVVGVPSGMSWDVSGIFVGQRDQGIFRCSPDGGAAEEVASVKEGEEVHGPQLLPGGTAVLFTLAKSADGPARWDKAQIVVQTLKSGARKTVIEAGSDARYLPTGQLLYALGGVVYAVPFDPARQRTTGPVVPVIEGVRRGYASGIAQFAVSNNGTMAYIPGPLAPVGLERALAIADRAGSVTPLSLPAGPYRDVRASRDGARIAVGTDDGNQAIIWVHEFAGTGQLRRLTLDGNNNRFPVWLPDGVRIAFQSDREKDAGIFIQRADGKGPAERLTKPEQGEAHVAQSWSRDGKHLVFSTVKGREWSLWIVSLEDKKAVRFGDVQSREPIGAAFSPDGRWIAYSSASATATAISSPDRGVYLQPFPATGERHQAPRRELDFHPAWSPNGAELIYVPTAASGQLAAVGVSTRAGVTFGTPVNLPARVTGDRFSGEMRAWDILPDGRFIGLVSPSAPDSTTSSASAQIRVVTNWFEELKQRVSAK